jgi:putative spermidine/putrescine transport system permease protein
MPHPLARSLLGGVFLILFAGFIVGPLIVLALWSFAQQWFWPSLLPSAFTLRWYEWAATVPNVFRSLQMSLIVAAIVTLATTIVAVPAAIAIGRYRFPGRDFIRGLFSLPLLVPYISLGIGISSFFYAARLNGTLAAVVLAHMIAALPVQMYAAMGEGYLQISSALAMLLLVPSVLLSYLIARYLRVDATMAG